MNQLLISIALMTFAAQFSTAQPSQYVCKLSDGSPNMDLKKDHPKIEKTPQKPEKTLHNQKRGTKMKKGGRFKIESQKDRFLTGFLDLEKRSLWLRGRTPNQLTCFMYVLCTVCRTLASVKKLSDT